MHRRRIIKQKKFAGWLFVTTTTCQVTLGPYVLQHHRSVTGPVLRHIRVSQLASEHYNNDSDLDRPTTLEWYAENCCCFKISLLILLVRYMHRWQVSTHDFYPIVTTLRWSICYRKFVCLSSDICMFVVCNVRAPYSACWYFRQCFYAILYFNHLLTSMQNFMSAVKRKKGSLILRFWPQFWDTVYIYEVNVAVQIWLACG